MTDGDAREKDDRRRREGAMRFLLLTQFYDPEPIFKPHILAKELLKRGHDVSVITGFPNYPSGKIYDGYRQRLLQRQNMDDVKLLRIPLYADHSKSGLKRSLNYLSFAASASAIGPMIAGKHDLMWVFHPPLTLGIPAMAISMLRRRKFVFEIQDMWPETIAATGMLNNRRALNMLGWLAKRIYRKAEAIIVITPGFKQNLIEKGVSAEKIHVIPNWADEHIYRPLPRDTDLGQRWGLEGKFNVMFAGNMGVAQGLNSVLTAAELLREHSEIQFVFIGEGVELPAVKAEAERLKLPNVKFIPRQAAAAMPEFLAWGDALLVHLTRDPLFKITVPSKVYAYLASGRPILCAVEGDAADTVRDARAGVCCPPEDPDAMAEAILRMVSMPKAERDAMGEMGRQAFIEQYSQRALLDKYERVFDIAAGRQPKEIAPVAATAAAATVVEPEVETVGANP